MIIDTVAMLVSFAVAGVLSWRLSRPGAPIYLLDHPNERSLHQHATPRTGGLAVIAGITLGLSILAWGQSLGPATPALAALAPGVVAIAIVSLLDDWLGASPAVRLVVHLAAAAFALLGPGDALGWRAFVEAHGWNAPLGLVGATLVVGWATNLYNFMDGMDGFAGGMTLVGFGTLGAATMLEGQPALGRICFVIAAAAGGFLLLNYPPARIFLGDVGSSVLGFLAGGVSLWGIASGAFPWWLALLAFSAFVVDATATVMRRLVAAERIWTPHTTHFYQRLVRLGWGHRRTVVAEYVLMVLSSASGLLVMLRDGEGWPILLAIWAVVFAALARRVRVLEAAGLKDRGGSF
jgi:UDP-N-acetylmuramyl pentapeptide phosphotransferase/UDP-N-acetylglucosamine-1-phosphate transferase